MYVYSVCYYDLPTITVVITIENGNYNNTEAINVLYNLWEKLLNGNLNIMQMTV